MDKVKFKKQVVAGDQLIMTAKFKGRGTIAVVEAKAEVEADIGIGGADFCYREINEFSHFIFIASTKRETSFPYFQLQIISSLFELVFAVSKYCLQQLNFRILFVSFPSLRKVSQPFGAEH